jgi:hypothetical protein
MVIRRLGKRSTIRADSIAYQYVITIGNNKVNDMGHSPEGGQSGPGDSEGDSEKIGWFDARELLGVPFVGDESPFDEVYPAEQPSDTTEATARPETTPTPPDAPLADPGAEHPDQSPDV